MVQTPANEIFTAEVMDELLPPELADEFFEALYGEADEGAYDIRLAFRNYDRKYRTLSFELQLHERPGKCLACNLTYGLPEVFSRHPLINIEGLVRKIEKLLDNGMQCIGWELGRTRTTASNLHTIPLTIRLRE